MIKQFKNRLTSSFNSKIWSIVFTLALIFSCSGNFSNAKSPVVAPAYQITGRGSAGPLKIERIEVIFDNGFGSITVNQNDRLSARALLRFSGNGLLRAQWEVDGQVVENVNLILSSGSLLTLPLTASPQLPTFEPGRHELSLNILQPQTTLKMPVIKYFVKLE